MNWWALAIALCFLGSIPGQAVPIYGYKVVAEYPHDPEAFTQGLFYLDGYLFESTGRYGLSSVRRVDLKTGRVLRKSMMPAHVFGEGITHWDGKIISLTWHAGIGTIWDVASLTPSRTFTYRGEGWGITSSDTALYMSDGTPELRVLDPVSLKNIRRIKVTVDGRALHNLNELEWVNGEIFANVWQTDRVARIDPETGKVTAWIDLSGLHNNPGANVLNGIAYDKGRLFVTGKLWSKLFEIELVPFATP